MIPVNILLDDILIKNIEPNELKAVLKCINESKENYTALGRENPMDYDEIEQRYLESLMNSLEIFCGIYVGYDLIGIIKGRIEDKGNKELWILSYMLIEQYRNRGIGTKTLKGFEEYFHFNLTINKFCILIMGCNENALRFWRKNKYKLTRVSQSSKLINNSEMLILEKIVK